MVEYYYTFRERVSTILQEQYGLPKEKVSWVKKIKTSSQPIAFFNKCNIYFDESSLPLICTNVTDLSNKYILYGILCNGKFYIGKTQDFGERMSTHIKDSRNCKSSQQLYKDMLITNECTTFIFGIVDNETLLEELEHRVIQECKDFSIELTCNNKEDLIKFIRESISDMKKYSSNYCYNIRD